MTRIVLPLSSPASLASAVPGKASVAAEIISKFLKESPCWCVIDPQPISANANGLQ